MNLLEKAIMKGEMLDFALGQNDYFLYDSEWGGHWVFGTWTEHIIPYATEHPECARYIQKMFSMILKEQMDPAEKMHYLLYHFYAYYHLKNDGQIKFLTVSGFIEDRVVSWLEANEPHFRLSGAVGRFNDFVLGIHAHGGLQDYVD